MSAESATVRFSLKSKLLISTISALLLLTFFLNFSSLVLFKEDKRAYIYSAQSTEASLAGKAFVQFIRHTLDSLKVAMGSIEPTKPFTEQQRAYLQALIENQSEIVFLRMSLLNPATGVFKPIAQITKTPQASKAPPLPNFELSPQDIPSVLADLNEQSYSLLNFSNTEGAPLIGVALGDVTTKTPEGFVVALGVISMQEFLRGIASQKLTIATLAGRVLYDSDPAVMYLQKDVSRDPLFKLAATNKIASGATEFQEGDSHFLGTYLRPGLDLAVLTKTDWKEAMKATYILGEKFILLAIMAISAAVIYALLFSRSLTTPLQLLFQGTKEIEKGNFELNLEIKSRDEIGALTGSFNSMSRKINELMEEFRKKVLLDQEVAIASAVQQTLIPSPSFQNHRVRIHSHYQAAADCGGDWWGFFYTQDKLCLMISDATGHGLPSALITAAARGYFSVMNLLAEADPDFTFSPSAMMAFANQVVFEASLGKIQMTFLIAVIDFSQMTMTYSSAGHTPAWLYSTNGSTFTQKSLVANGMRLGERRDVPPWEEKTVPIKPDDVLFLYTDGVIEGTDKEGAMFAKKRLKQAIDASVAEGPEGVVQNVMKQFNAFQDGKGLDDDVTLVAVKVLAQTEERAPVG